MVSQQGQSDLRTSGLDIRIQNPVSEPVSLVIPLLANFDQEKTLADNGGPDLGRR